MRRRFACILSAIALLILASLFITYNASAEETTNFSIEETEVIGDIPRDGDVGLIDWGGGTLLQLATKMNKEGCNLSSVHTLTRYSNFLEYSINYSYDFEASIASNRSFARKYLNNIPEGRLIVSCSDDFDFEEDSDDLWVCDDPEYNTDWSDAVEERVISKLGIIGDPCVLYFDNEEYAESELGVFVSFPSQYFSHFSYTLDDNDVLHLENDVYRPIVVVIVDHEEYLYEPIFSEVYEACRAQQEWYVRYTRLHSRYYNIPWWEVWEKTPAGKEFIRLFNWRITDGEWYLPTTSIFNNFDADRPVSLAAEICQIYFLNQMYQGLELEEYLPQPVMDWVKKYIDVLS